MSDTDLEMAIAERDVAESRANRYEQALRKAGDFADAMIERGNKDNNVLAILAHIRAALGKPGGIPQTPDV